MHGIRATYTRGCRCDECRAANTKRCAVMREKRLAKIGNDAHGTKGAYVNAGCRCDLCREANRVGWLAWATKRRRDGLPVKPAHPVNTGDPAAAPR